MSEAILLMVGFVIGIGFTVLLDIAIRKGVEDAVRKPDGK